MQGKLLPHPGVILSDYFKSIKKKRKAYSVRALARDADLSPAFVSQVFAKKRCPSIESLNAFHRVLKIANRDFEILQKSIILHAKRNSESASLLRKYIQNDPLTNSYFSNKKEDMNSLLALREWYYVAIMELLECSNVPIDVRELAKRLSISVSQASAAISLLIQVGLIEKVEGRWKKKNLHQEFPCDTSQVATRNYHVQMINQALTILQKPATESAIKRRRITGATLAVNPRKLPIVVEEMNRFLARMIETLTEGECTEVYQFNLQLMPLTNPATQEGSV